MHTGDYVLSVAEVSRVRSVIEIGRWKRGSAHAKVAESRKVEVGSETLLIYLS